MFFFWGRKPWGIAVALVVAVVVFLVANAGGSGGGSVETGLSVTSAPLPVSTSTSISTITTNAAGQTIYSYRMPASSTPTNCAVVLHDHDATIAFHSHSLDVSPAIAVGCRAARQWRAMGPSNRWLRCGWP